MNKRERDKAFRYLRAASRYESRLHNRASITQHGFWVRNYFLMFQATPFLIAVVLSVIRKAFSTPEWVGVTGLFILLFAYLATLAHPFLLVWINRRVLINGIRNPIGILLENADITAIVDARILRHFMRYSTENLEFLALELKVEKEFFEKRISLVVGAIEKIGLAPGLLAISVSISDIQIGQSNWVDAIAYATPILYVSGVAGHFLLMRLDRYVKVTELVLNRKMTSE